MTIVLFIVILGLLVLVHELGHFWAARRSGVGVLEFGFGFPPRLAGFRRGPTIYSINLIPFGGFVRLVGESDQETEQADSLAKASLAKRLGIMAAGVAMNYLLAWVLFTAVLVIGVPTSRSNVPNNGQARLTDIRVESYVSPGSVAERSGLKTGDRVTTINGQRFDSTDSLVTYLREQSNPALHVAAITKEGKQQKYTLVPASKPSANQPVYGFGLQEVGQLRYPWFVAPWFGGEYVLTVTGQTFTGFYDLLRSLVTQGKISEDLSGPIGIAVLTGEIRRLGLVPILQFMGVLSVSLAVINFLPLPALDGGRAFFAVLDRLSPKRINPRWEQVVHASGFYLLLLLIVLISIRDVQRFDLFDRVRQLFQ